MIQALSRLGRQSTLYIVGDVLVQAMALILLPLYTRVLTPDAYGILGLVNTVQRILVSVMSLGIAAAITRFYYDSNSDTERRQLIGAIWQGWLLILVTLAILLELLGFLFGDYLFVQISFRPYLELALWIAALRALADIPRAVMRVRGQAGLFSIFSISNFGLSLILIIYFMVILEQGVVGSLKGQVIGALIIGIFYLTFMASATQWTWEFTYLKQALIFGLPLVPHLLASWVLNFADRWVLERYVSLQEIGIYTLAYQFGLMMSMILSSINRAWGPFFFEKAQQAEGRAILVRLVTYYAFLIIFISLAISLLSQPIISLIADLEYHIAFHYVPIIAAGYLMLGLYFIASNAIFFTKQTKYLPFITGGAAIVNVGANLLLTPKFGVMGAAISTFIGYASLFIITLMAAQCLFTLNYEFRRIGSALLVAITIFGLGWWLHSESTILTFSLRLLVLCLFPIGLIVTRLLTSQELNAMRTLMQSLRVRGS